MGNRIVQSSYQQASSDATSQQPSSSAANLGGATAVANDADESSTPSVVGNELTAVAAIATADRRFGRSCGTDRVAEA